MGIRLGDELGDLGLFAPGFLSGSTCPWLEGSGQVPLSTEPIQGDVRVFYPLVSPKSHPQGCQGAEGAWFGEAVEPLDLQPDKSCPRARQIPHLCSTDAADMILQGDCNSWHCLKIQP